MRTQERAFWFALVTWLLVFILSKLREDDEFLRNVSGIIGNMEYHTNQINADVAELDENAQEVETSIEKMTHTVEYLRTHQSQQDQSPLNSLN